MKYLILLISILSFSFCKKDTSEIYMINKSEWKYTKPDNYVFRVNNSVNSNKERDDSPFMNPEDMSQNEYILLTASKKFEDLEKWSDSNLVMATYTKAKFIKKYGSLKKYLNKSKEFLDKTYSKEKSKPEIIISEEIIAGRKFDVMTQNFVKFQDKFTFTNVSYYRIIDEELFQIMLAYNNDEDKKNLLAAFEKSEFSR